MDCVDQIGKSRSKHKNESRRKGEKVRQCRGLVEPYACDCAVHTRTRTYSTLEQSHRTLCIDTFLSVSGVNSRRRRRSRNEFWWFTLDAHYVLYWYWLSYMHLYLCIFFPFQRNVMCSCFFLVLFHAFVSFVVFGYEVAFESTEWSVGRSVDSLWNFCFVWFLLPAAINAAAQLEMCGSDSFRLLALNWINVFRYRFCSATDATDKINASHIYWNCSLRSDDARFVRVHVRRIMFSFLISAFDLLI